MDEYSEGMDTQMMKSMVNDFSHLPDGYDPKIVNLVIYCLFFANLFVNVDMGILPAGSTIIKKELKLNNG